MALFYTGYRPILRGQSDSDWVNSFTGKVGVYSNWSLMSKSHLLDGDPQANHVPGTGRHPHDLFLSRRFTGLDTKNPLDAPGLGPRVFYGPLAGEGGRYHPWEFKGLTADRAMPSGYGHVAFRVTSYSFYVNWFFHGLPADQQLLNPGHGIRPISVGASTNIKDGTGPAATFGYFNPYLFKGVISAKEVNNPGQALPTDRDHLGGHNRVNEWWGITSSQALATGSGRFHHGNH